MIRGFVEITVSSFRQLERQCPTTTLYFPLSFAHSCRDLLSTLHMSLCLAVADDLKVKDTYSSQRIVKHCCNIDNIAILYFDTRSQNGRLAHCKCKNTTRTRGRGRQAEVENECCIFTRAVSESPVWPHVSNHIFLYKFMRTRVGSPFTDIENAPQLNFTRLPSTRRY